MIASVKGSRIVNVVPCPSHGADINGAAQVLNPALDDVHANATPGDLCDRLGSAQPRVPDKGNQLTLSQLAGFGLAHEPLGDDLRANSLAVDAMAIVADGDHNAIAAVRRRERYRASTRLANGLSFAQEAQAHGQPHCGPCGSKGRKAHRSSACRARSFLR